MAIQISRRDIVVFFGGQAYSSKKQYTGTAI